MTEVLTQEKLKQLQEVLLEILKEFDRVCRENDLTYQVFSGTLLGAIRHDGFIPWDDDVDVCMLREDYEKFIEISKEKLNKRYFLQTPHSDPHYVHSFARLQKEGTVLVQDSWAHTKMKQQIFIDIFPMDDVNPNSKKGKFQYKINYAFKRFKNLRRLNFDLVQSRKNVKRKKTIQKFLKIFPLKWFYFVENRIYKMLDGQEKIVSLLTDGWEDTYENYIMDKALFYDVIDLNFEDLKAMGPQNYDTVLKRNFGDYMSLPPEEDRKPHHGVINLKI